MLYSHQQLQTGTPKRLDCRIVLLVASEMMPADIMSGGWSLLITRAALGDKKEIVIYIAYREGLCKE
jgi:hypothetical protein